MATHENPPVLDKLPVRSGKRYTNVEALLLATGTSNEVTEKVAELAEATRMTRILAALRASHGLTQKEMGDKLGVTQGAISKLESGRDEDLKLSEICAYARALNERIGIVYGPEMNHVQAITAHLNRVKFHMFALARIAQNDSEMDNRMNKFFSETFFSVMELMASVYTKLPNGVKGCEFTTEIIYPTAEMKNQASQPSAPTSPRELVTV